MRKKKIEGGMVLYMHPACEKGEVTRWNSKGSWPNPISSLKPRMDPRWSKHHFFGWWKSVALKVLGQIEGWNPQG